MRRLTLSIALGLMAVVSGCTTEYGAHYGIGAPLYDDYGDFYDGGCFRCGAFRPHEFHDHGFRGDFHGGFHGGHGGPRMR